MEIRGRGRRALCATAALASMLSACTERTPEPTSDDKRATHHDRLREAGQKARREALAIQRQKLSYGVPPASSSPTEDECTTRWSDLRLTEETPGARSVFISKCAEFPAPATPGYAEAVAEAESSTP
ncbi:hypothetical protein [Streptomyces lavendofoliae]|uniref:hypothetical protein n=1 Tax=Streptomyces lavendofoliae TaxID=67314 RepID=UPI003D8C7489